MFNKVILLVLDVIVTLIAVLALVIGLGLMGSGVTLLMLTGAVLSASALFYLVT